MEIKIIFYRIHQDTDIEQLRMKLVNPHATHDYGIDDNGDGYYGEAENLKRFLLAAIANLDYPYIVKETK